MTTARTRVLLVTPPYHAGVVEAAGTWMPLQMAYLAGEARRAGAEVWIFDAMGCFYSHDEIVAAVEDFRPDILGITAITATEPDSREVCRNARRVDPGIVTVLGNVHPTFCWSQILTEDESVDVIVRGEGEATFAELVRAVGAGADLGTVDGIAYRQDGHPTATPSRPFVPDLDVLEPAWDLLEWPKYYYRPHPTGRFAIVSSSRGCKQACSFCSQQKFWEKSWRARAPAPFVDELAMLRERFDVQVAMLSDETPTVDPERWERLLDLLIERDLGVELLMETRVDDINRDEAILPKYVAAGVSHIYVGVESADQETLDQYKKDTTVEQGRRAIELINQHDIISETSFVLGVPTETPESIAMSLEVAKYYGPDMAFFLALAPWPYADIHAELEPHIAVRDYRKYNLVDPVIKPDAMTLEELRTALHMTTGHFFHDKFMRLGELSEKKRKYMVKVLKLLIENSYLGREMHRMASGAGMPTMVKTMLSKLGIEFDAP